MMSEMKKSKEKKSAAKSEMHRSNESHSHVYPNTFLVFYLINGDVSVLAM